MEGANRFILLMYPLPLTGIIFENRSFVRFEVRRRKWLLPPFVRTSLPEPVNLNRLAVALWVLSLYFFFDFLRVTINSYHTKYRGLYVHPRDNNFVVAGNDGGTAFIAFGDDIMQVFILR